MKLIPNFAGLLHAIELPSPEKFFLIEDGDEKNIEQWISNREITCELEKMVEWINHEYKLKKKNQTAKTDK